MSTEEFIEFLMDELLFFARENERLASMYQTERSRRTTGGTPLECRPWSNVQVAPPASASDAKAPPLHRELRSA